MVNLAGPSFHNACGVTYIGSPSLSGSLEVTSVVSSPQKHPESDKTVHPVVCAEAKPVPLFAVAVSHVYCCRWHWPRTGERQLPLKKLRSPGEAVVVCGTSSMLSKKSIVMVEKMLINAVAQKSFLI